MTIPESVKGAPDWLPPASAAFTAVEAAFLEVARLGGYERVRTPIFEHTEVFSRGVGASTDVVQKEMYTFEDKGGRSLTLRPEGFEVTPASVIALLTILGYSIYDTVVVFDRVQENAARLTSVSSQTYAQVANTSLNQVLVRSISTSVTALLPVGSLLFVGASLLGADTLRDLALALFVGMAVGTYSSVFVATPLLVWLKEREPRYAQLRERAAARGR